MKNTLQTIIKYGIWAFIFAAASYAYATGTWVEPTEPPPGGNPDAPINAGSDEQTKTGPLNVGGLTSVSSGIFSTDISVGTADIPPSGVVALLNGKVAATEYCDLTGTTCIDPTTYTGDPGDPGADGASIPSGAIMAFDLAACPTGWIEATAVRGRYIVGLPQYGTLRGVSGTALTNLESRPTGAHSHTYNMPVTSGKVTGAVSGSTIYAPASRSSGITGIAGTNAPYIQYLMCKKV